MTKRKYTISEIDDLLKKYDEGELKFLYFVDADFSGLDLTDKIFAHVHFTRCDFSNCNLEGTQLNHSVFEYCIFTDTILTNTSFNNAMMIRPKGLTFISVDHLGYDFEGRAIYIPDIDLVEFGFFKGTLDQFEQKIEYLKDRYEDDRLCRVLEYFKESTYINFSKKVNTADGQDSYNGIAPQNTALSHIFDGIDATPERASEMVRYLLG